MKKKYKYVITVGCSFSSSDNGVDYLVNVGETYGDVVAKHYGAKSYNLAKVGAGIDRMCRVVLEWYRKVGSYKDTLIILGLPDFGREEIWSNGLSDWYSDGNLLFTDDDVELKHHSNETLDKSSDLYIPNLVIYHWSLEERKKYFLNFYNDVAQFYKRTNDIIGLQSFLTLNNIDHVFFDAFFRIDTYWAKFSHNIDIGEKELKYKVLWDDLVSRENWYVHPEYKSMVHLLEVHPEMRILENDGHPGKEAHKYWGECLLEYINEKT